MVISAKIIRNPRKARRCERCQAMIEGSQLRLYGYGERPDPPYVVYVHPTQRCITYSSDALSHDDKVITKALEGVKEQ